MGGAAKRRKEKFPELYGTAKCPGAGIRPPSNHAPPGRVIKPMAASTSRKRRWERKERDEEFQEIMVEGSDDGGNDGEPGYE